MAMASQDRAGVIASARMIGFDPGAAAGAALVLENPVEARSVFAHADVPGLLRDAEAAARRGAWVVVAVAYEAAPAFDAAMCVHEAAGDFPLASMAVFGRAESESCMRGHRRSEDRRSEDACRVGEWRLGVSHADYRRALDRIHEYILAGDTYQINYTYRQEAAFEGDAGAWFADLAAAQGRGYFAHLDMGAWQVLSLSPELFFERRGERIVSRPMKGTMPRGRWLEEDAAQMERLAASAKERAENVMIVDLIRNDLGRVAETGSVRVVGLFEVERYPTVLQMTSRVEARVRAGAGLPEIMGALFPCGSITGAPKLRAMEIIRELEAGPRGIYTGTIGLVRPGGDAVFNVAIRTLALHRASGRALFGVGGGITHDSLVEGEWAECGVKGAFLAARPEFELLETLLCENGAWFLLEGHLRRMRDSACYFEFSWDEGRIRAKLEAALPAGTPGAHRVRLLLGRDGGVTVEAQAVGGEPGRVWRVALAREPVDSRDVFLYHKTTRREVYDRAKAARPDCDDMILWNERGEVTESTIANVILERDGRRVTPGRGCGLLAGVMREYLLAAGDIEEGVIRREELTPGSEIILINSVRKSIHAVIVE